MAILVAVAVAVYGTWPLATTAHDHVYGNVAPRTLVELLWQRDVYLTQWILAWDLHALRTAPTRLFDANIFHPARDTLALSEHLLGALPLYAPLALVSGNPVLAHQGTLVATFVLALLTAGALAADTTGSVGGALVGAALFAFSAFRSGALGALHTLGNFYLPLVALCARRAIIERGWRWPAGLAAALVLQTLHSIYLGYVAFVSAAVLVAILCADPAGRGAWQRLGMAIGTALVLAGISALPYLAIQDALAPPSAAVLSRYSAMPGHTGSTPALAIALVTVPFWRRGLAPSVRWTWLPALVAAGVSGYVLALGEAARLGDVVVPLPLAVLRWIVPGMGLMRAPVRFNALTTLALAMLAGTGVAGALRTLTARGVPDWLATSLGGGLAIALVVATAPRPVPVVPIEVGTTVPPAYRWIAAAPRGPLLEVPFGDVRGRAAEREALRMYRSVYHWQPLLNGYSGQVPRSYAVVGALARCLPDPRAVALLARATGLRYVLVHRAELGTQGQRRWRRSRAGLRVAATFGDDVVLVLRRDREPDLMEALRDGMATGRTLLGTSLTSLPPDARQGRVTLAGPHVRRGRTGVPLELTAVVRNQSPSSWPALAVREEHLVTLKYEWETDGGEGLEPGASRLPFDLAPGAAVRIPLTVDTPHRPGRWRLRIAIGQEGARWGSVDAMVDLR